MISSQQPIFPVQAGGNEMNFIKRNLLSILALAAMALFSLFIYDSLPEQVPTDFNLQGEVTDTSPRLLVALLMPLVYALVIVLINALIWISPQNFSMPNSKRAMDIIIFGTGVLLLFIHVSMLIGNGDMDLFVRLLSYGMAAFLIITGNVFGKTERNFFLGIRIPWTLASAANWKATHRVAGKLMVLFGFVLIVSNTIVPNLLLMILLAVAPVVIPVFYSLYYYLKYEKPSEAA
jgi:uncharacterized membrane protein